jgi:ABC-type protease/lipase transport system fused ATPase/permease subunit
VDFQSIDKAMLGQAIGYLPQDVSLLEGTVAENICRFSEVDSERVIEAAKIAGIHEMILKMPKGYDTFIGDNSGVFSGGQRQRIGLARAVYGDPAFFLFDEPNSNLDDIGEKSLISIINNLKLKNKTVILVTHKTNILSELDGLILLENGSIVAHGKKEEVMIMIEKRKIQAQATF